MGAICFSNLALSINSKSILKDKQLQTYIVKIIHHSNNYDRQKLKTI